MTAVAESKLSVKKMQKALLHLTLKKTERFVRKYL